MKAIKYFLLIPAVLFWLIDAYAQSDNYTKYQDTVFVKHTKDWTSDTLSYTTDTVVFETGMRRNLLTGTAILPATHHSMIAKGYGFWFDKVTKSDCKKDVTEKGGLIHDRINSVLITDTSLIIDFNLYDNCCYDFLCDISVDESGILNLIYTGYGTYCACDCRFGLTYHISVTEVEDNPKVKFVMLNGNTKTMKPIIKKQ